MKSKHSLRNLHSAVLLMFIQTVSSSLPPFQTVEHQLIECQTGQSTTVAGHLKEITKLMDEYTKLQKDLEDLTSKAVADTSYRQFRITEKRNTNSLLQRTLMLADSTLSLKFDCISNAITSAECQRYCAFPYGYDSCSQTDEQKQFVRRILMEAGWDKVLFRYYNKNKGIDEEVKLSPEHYQVTSRGRQHPHEHHGPRHGGLGHRRNGHRNPEMHKPHHGPRRHREHRLRMGGGFRRSLILPIVNDTNICTQVHAAIT